MCASDNVVNEYKTALRETHNAHIRTETLFLRNSGSGRVLDEVLHYCLEYALPNGCIIVITSNNFSIGTLVSPVSNSMCIGLRHYRLRVGLIQLLQIISVLLKTVQYLVLSAGYTIKEILIKQTTHLFFLH